MKFQSNSIFNGTITANSVADAGTNTDKFLVLNSSGVVTYRTAAELYADLGVGSSSAAYTAVLKHPVKAGEAINKGQAVYVSSADGTNMIVTKASNATEATSSKTIGLLETTLANNGIGNVITEGLLAGLDTTGATNAGDPVWLGTGGNLIYGLINKPYAPAHLVFIGIVTRINVSNGEIFVKVQNGFELKEIHDVDLITTTPVNGHILGYNGTLWVNKTIAGWLGFTPVTNARTLTINGTAYDLSADRSWTISSMIYPGAGIAVSTGTAWGTSITDNSTNWNTAYTNRITSLTVTGSSGAATLVSNVLNIPTYTLAGLGGVATSRTLTINGTAYDLSADRSWTIDSTSASTRTIQKFTATSGQTTFTITGGYAVGMVDVYMNGVKLDNATDFTASNGTTVVLAAGALTNSVIEVYKFGSQFIPNNALRVVTSFTATAAQTTFTVNYSVGLVDVFYNGSCLAQSEYTATNGTSIILATACQVNDIVVVYAYSYSVGAYSGIGGSGTSNYLPKFTGTSSIGNSAVQTDSSGNIGIGAAPVTLLYAYNASGTAELRLERGGAGDVGMRWKKNSADLGYISNADWIIAGATTTDFAVNAVNNLVLGTASTARMTILSGGDIQIPVGKYLQWNAYSDAASRSWAIRNNESAVGDFAIVSSTTNSNTVSAVRMTITSDGNVGVGITGVYSNVRLMSRGVDATASNYAFRAETSAAANLMYIRNDGLIVTGLLSGSPYNYTTGSAANMYVSGGGELQRSTSSLKYKTDVKDYDKGLSEVLQMRPVYYKGKNDGDTQFAGLIAEEIHDLGLTEFVQYAEDGTPDALAYSNMIALLTKAIQEMNSKIIELEKLVATK